MNTESLKKRVEDLVAKVSESVKSGDIEDLDEWTNNLQYALAHMDTICYGMPMVQNIEAYVNGNVSELVRIDDQIVRNTQNALICRLSKLMRRKSEKMLRPFIAYDSSKTISSDSPYLYRGHRCQLTKNNNSKTLHITLDNHSDDAEVIMAMLTSMMLK